MTHLNQIICVFQNAIHFDSLFGFTKAEVLSEKFILPHSDVIKFFLFSGFTYNSFKSFVSVVGIATRYRLEGPGIESRWGRDFPHLSRPAPRPIQPPVQWVPGLSRRQSGRGVVLTTHPYLVPRYTERSRAIPLLSPKRPSRPTRKGENLKTSQAKSFVIFLVRDKIYFQTFCSQSE